MLALHKYSGFGDQTKSYTIRSVQEDIDMLKSCDTVVALSNATVDNQVIFGKNSDRSAVECQPLVLRGRKSHLPDSVTNCQFIQLPEVRTTYRHIGSTPYWCWGDEHGFNEHQVVIGNEGLGSKCEFDSPKLIGMELVRLGLERASTAAEAVEVMTTLITKYGQGKFSNQANVRTYDNGYIIADPREAYILETAGHEWAAKRVDSVAGISNVYSIEDDWDCLSPTALEHAIADNWWMEKSEQFNFAEAYSHQADRSVGSGAIRRRRSCTLLNQHLGNIDIPTTMAVLSDHGGDDADKTSFDTMIKQGGICVHHDQDGTGGNTAASLVAHLCADNSRLPVYWCSFYSPCLGVFLPMFIEGELPPVLAIGNEEPSDESPWWLFRQLSLQSRSDKIGSISTIQERWKRFQKCLFESAYKIAKAGRELIDDQCQAEAKQLLTKYMAENVEVMLKTVREMLTGTSASDTRR